MIKKINDNCGLLTSSSSFALGLPLLLVFSKSGKIYPTLSLYVTMDSSFSFNSVNFAWSIVCIYIYIEGSQVIIFQIKIVFLSLKIVFV